MKSEYISFGNITLKLNLPQETVGKNLYREFFCEKKAPDYEVNYSFIDCVTEPEKESAFFESSDFIVEKKNDCCRFYYKNRADNGFYAVREKYDGSCRINIFLDSSIKNKLWTRIILNTIGIEELAIGKGGIVFHSSFIDRNGKAVLFTGPCSIGKSTQAKLWNNERKTPIINGDKTYIYLEEDTVFASGLPFSGSSGICKNKKMPLDFIVRLEKASKNNVEILSAKEAFFAVADSCYVPPFGFAVQASEIASRIVQKIRVCRLSCLPDASAVETLEKFMEKERIR